ncbi:SigmaW regulon antibacterial [Pseudobythopirellula maris]|uniref:Flotillin-like protein FloA n=1 Tax=Pseudobythopirellula maris TaxID=2527991 RepID=A0A5C5ZPD8_9BACT|nr:flotillin-like protein FloA [Pseudobythopirellula maris]TWT89036.1 SigmaW regulon antibacterial [Pseudobythopirellula maris]
MPTPALLSTMTLLSAPLLPPLAQNVPQGRSILMIFIILMLMALVVAGAIFVFSYGKLWLQAMTSNAPVSPLTLVFMSLRQVSPRTIVDARIQAMQAGVSADSKGISTKKLEAHYLAGGNVPRVISAIIAAHRADIDLDFDRAAAIDLAGRDVLDAVKTSVYPKVIDCPDPEKSPRTTLSAVAKNGVEVKVRARVTVRTNLKQLIGGATEETIIARVGEGIITAIGSAKDEFEVVENPDRISKAVLDRGLDAQTAFEIVSIDIADIDIGENIGARLQVDQAEADTRKAQALAEKRRANAIAHEQEMKAEVALKRGDVLLAEADVPRAMAEAFRGGRLVIQDPDASGVK